MVAAASHPTGRQRGFTLVEVLVASLILAIALLSLSTLFTLGLKNSAVAREDTVMAALAQDKLEQYRRLPRTTLDFMFPAECRGPCVSGCSPCGLDPYPVGCDDDNCCSHACYPGDAGDGGCAADDRSLEFWEDPVADPNPSDNIRERLYVRHVQVDKVSLGAPVGCVFKVSVTVGSRNGLFSPAPPSSVSWLRANAEDVIGSSNPRRVLVSAFRR